MSSLGLIRQGGPGIRRDEFGTTHCCFEGGCAAAQLVRLRNLAHDHNLDFSKIEQAAREAGWEVA